MGGASLSPLKKQANGDNTSLTHSEAVQRKVQAVGGKLWTCKVIVLLLTAHLLLLLQKEKKITKFDLWLSSNRRSHWKEPVKYDCSQVSNCSQVLFIISMGRQ